MANSKGIESLDQQLRTLIQKNEDCSPKEIYSPMHAIRR
jgi:hypothetical protein